MGWRRSAPRCTSFSGLTNVIQVGRQEDAARALKEAAAAVARFIDACPDATWYRRVETEAKMVAAIAYHWALGNDVALGWICQLLARRPVYETREVWCAEIHPEWQRSSPVRIAWQSSRGCGPDYRPLTVPARAPGALLFIRPADEWTGRAHPDGAEREGRRDLGLGTTTTMVGRPHMALDLVAPDPRPTPETGMIVRERKLFGLTTEYSRAA